MTLAPDDVLRFEPDADADPSTLDLHVRRRRAGRERPARHGGVDVDPGLLRRAGQRTTDLVSEVCDPRFLNPQTGPFFVEGAAPGDTLAVHFRSITPARVPAVSARPCRCSGR